MYQKKEKWTWEMAEVYFHDNKWWFTGQHGRVLGPYLTKQSAYSALFTYTDNLNEQVMDED